MAESDRRTCLVAIFSPLDDTPPIVLLDIDHSGDRALATLLLRYRKHLRWNEIEAHIKDILDSAVFNGGHWNPTAESRIADLIDFERLRRVLRVESRETEAGYLQGVGRAVDEKGHVFGNTEELGLMWLTLNRSGLYISGIGQRQDGEGIAALRVA